MTKYEFDFSRTTLSELERCRMGTFEDILVLYDRIVVGGIMHLSLNEIAYGVTPQFTAAVTRWVQYGQVGDMMRPKPKVYNTPHIDDNSVRDMLDGIEGL